MARPGGVWRAVLLAGVLAAGVHAQPSPSPTDDPGEKPKASAVKLPDGTVVFLTDGGNDANPTVNGVVLSADEYQALVSQAEAAKEVAKPLPPSGVAVRGRVETRGRRVVAALTLTYTFRTTRPRTPVSLGCQRAAVVAAKTADGKLPVLTADGGGLTVLAEAAGEHTVTVQAEVPVTARPTKGEVGFELGLPRAAISTFTLDKPPAPGVGKVNVGTRGAGELLPTVKTTTVAADQLAAKPLALGPTDLLVVTWEPPGTAPTGPGLSADADVTVRVDDAQVETVAKIRLRGVTAECPLTLPPNAEVSVTAVGLVPLPMATATVVKPTDPNKPTWLIRTPADGPTEWVVTVTARQTRPQPPDPKARGPFAVGPFTVAGVRPSGKVAVFAPPGIRLGFKPSPDLRRQDLPPLADDDLIALFSTPAAPPAGPWLDLDARSAAGLIRVRPQHKLKLTPGGWKLESTVRVVPPQRTDLDQLTLVVPDGWSGIEIGPSDLVEAIPELGDGQTYWVRLITPQKAGVELTVTGVYPIAPDGGSADIPLPYFPQTDERDTKLTAAVGDGLELTGTGYRWENGRSAAAGEPLAVSGRGAAATGVSGEFDRGMARVELRWQPYRPELGCVTRAEVTVHPRQLSVTQVFRFTAPEGGVKGVKFRGPADVLGLRADPPLAPLGPGEWEYRPTNDPGKEFAVTVQFAARLPAGAAESPVPLVWCDTATRTEAVARVWGGGGPRAAGFTGRWRELPPEPAADRDSLPWFTLAAGGSEPLTLTLADSPDAGGPVVDRGLIQAGVAADGVTTVRARYTLARWPGGGVELDLPAGGPSDVLVNGQRVEPIWTDGRVLVPMPEVTPGGRSILDVVCRGLTAADGRGGRAIVPPVVRGASYRGPVRWYVACPNDCVPLVTDAGWDAEHRWTWRGYAVGPRPADSPAEMERWLRGEVEPTAGEPDDIGMAVAVRRATAEPLRVTLAPFWPWLLGASAVGLVVVVGIAQLRLSLVGPAVAALAVALATAAVALPQPTAQAVAAAQPGLVVGGGLIAFQFAWRWYRKRRIERLPTFSRTRPAEVPAARTSRSSRTGSSGSVVPFEARPTG